MTVWANQERRQVARFMHGESLKGEWLFMKAGVATWVSGTSYGQVLRVFRKKRQRHPPTKPTNLEIFKVCILENFNIGKELRKIQREEIILNIRGGQKGHLKVRHDDRYGAISTALCTLALGQYGARRGAEGHEQRTLLLKTVVFSMYKGIG